MVGVQLTNSTIESAYSSVSLHPDGQILGTGTEQGIVHVWETRSQNVGHCSPLLLLQTLLYHEFTLLRCVEAQAEQQFCHLQQSYDHNQFYSCPHGRHMQCNFCLSIPSRFSHMRSAHVCSSPDTFRPGGLSCIDFDV